MAEKSSKYNKRRWSVPSKRAKGYAADRKAKVHTYGPKEGKELTGYLDFIFGSIDSDDVEGDEFFTVIEFEF